ncbi:MAG TPA: YidB family protein [Pseudorhodoplanes sp.]|nr:YidB family protein [Pseudorhodoplanes sp.]
MTALLGLLAIAGYQNRDKLAELIKDFSNKNQAGGAQQGELGGLGGLLGGASVGGLLNGGLGELLKQFEQNGQKETVDSWVGKGPNREIAPPDLKQALDPEVLQTLSRATGLSEQELLARLSKELPNAVDKYTPEGRIAA